ncbi:unnamed protein product [Caenorhabditis auriculariae]|uniref:Uncharacterized protein n=1 Tax=Caenorhabditis auriculariae TaxID=2777116 RepID=A0A8S1GW26_9PELO|nr:unnamed protein product [Caenorhabditis auriculariae]
MIDNILCIDVDRQFRRCLRHLNAGKNVKEVLRKLLIMDWPANFRAYDITDVLLRYRCSEEYGFWAREVLKRNTEETEITSEFSKDGNDSYSFEKADMASKFSRPTKRESSEKRSRSPLSTHFYEKRKVSEMMSLSKPSQNFTDMSSNFREDVDRQFRRCLRDLNAGKNVKEVLKELLIMDWPANFRTYDIIDVLLRYRCSEEYGFWAREVLKRNTEEIEKISEFSKDGDDPYSFKKENGRTSSVHRDRTFEKVRSCSSSRLRDSCLETANTASRFSRPAEKERSEKKSYSPLSTHSYEKRKVSEMKSLSKPSQNLIRPNLSQSALTPKYDFSSWLKPWKPETPKDSNIKKLEEKIIEKEKPPQVPRKTIFLATLPISTYTGKAQSLQKKHQISSRRTHLAAEQFLCAPMVVKRPVNTHTTLKPPCYDSSQQDDKKTKQEHQYNLYTLLNMKKEPEDYPESG